jgi:serine/threonine-protein kinase
MSTMPHDDPSQSSPTGREQREALLNLVHDELERRLKAGEAARVESCLERYPELAGDRSAVLSLIEAEYELRLRNEPTLSPAEYLERFPPYRAEVLDRLQTSPGRRLATETLAGKDVPAQAGAFPASTAEAVLAMLRELRLLSPSQLEEAGRFEGDSSGDAGSLIQELLLRGWLTAYQADQLLFGRAQGLFLGPYLLLEPLGEGGMGQVFKARHRRLNRTVALKLIRSERLAQPESVRRFLREAQAAARLTHPHIVSVYDADQDGTTHFLSMEYVEGIDLAKLVKRDGPLPVHLACDYVRQASLGLQHAHDRGLVHRDVKPANPLRSEREGVIKVLDMGLARVERPGDGDHSVSSTLAQEGTMMGTPDYIAPEQALDPHQVDIRADVYSLGCTLYYLLTGRPPFVGGTLTQKLLWHQQAEPQAVEDRRAGVPAGLAGVLRKMLAKRPEERYQTSADVARALEPFCREGGTAWTVAAAQAAEMTTSEPTRIPAPAEGPDEGPEGEGARRGFEWRKEVLTQVHRKKTPLLSRKRIHPLVLGLTILMLLAIPLFSFLLVTRLTDWPSGQSVDPSFDPAHAADPGGHVLPAVGQKSAQEILVYQLPVPAEAGLAVRADPNIHDRFAPHRGALAIVLDCSGSMGPPPRGSTGPGSPASGPR